MKPDIVLITSPIANNGIRIGVDRLSLLNPMAHAPHRKSNHPYKTIANKNTPKAIHPSKPYTPELTTAMRTPPVQKAQKT